MFTTLETDIGLDIVIWLQRLRSPLLDNLLFVLDFAGDELFYIAALAAVYWIFNKKLGLRAYFALVFIGLSTFLVKDLLARPRPYELGTLAPLLTESGFGFPSFHTAASLVIWGYIAYWSRSRKAAIIVAVYVVIQALGRMIAGVHYPQDVLGGIILGGVVLALMIRYGDAVASRWSGRSAIEQTVFIVIITAILVIFTLLALRGSSAQEPYLTLAGLLLGGGLAAVFEPRWVRFAVHDSRLRRLIQYIIGLALAIGLLLGLNVLFDAITETGLLAELLRVIRYACVAFFSLGLWPLVSQRVGLMARETG